MTLGGRVGPGVGRHFDNQRLCAFQGSYDTGRGRPGIARRERGSPGQRRRSQLRFGGRRPHLRSRAQRRRFRMGADGNQCSLRKALRSLRGPWRGSCLDSRLIQPAGSFWERGKWGGFPRSENHRLRGFHRPHFARRLHDWRRRCRIGGHRSQRLRGFRDECRRQPNRRGRLRGGIGPSHVFARWNGHGRFRNRHVGTRCGRPGIGQNGRCDDTFRGHDSIEVGRGLRGGGDGGSQNLRRLNS